MDLSKEDRELLQAIAEQGTPCRPKDDALKDACKRLAAMKLLRPQTFIDGNAAVGRAAVFVAYTATAAGRKTLAAV